MWFSMSELLTTLFPILVGSCAVSAFITCGLGAYVIGQNPSSPTNRLFFAVAVSATLWALGEFFIWQSGSYEDSLFWLRASSLWSFVIVLSAHFTLVFVGHPLAQKSKRWILLIFLYLPALLITLVGISTDLIYTVAFQPGIGYYYHPTTASPTYYAVMAYAALVMVCTLYVSISAWRRARPGRERRQHRLVSSGIATVVGFGILAGQVFPSVGIHTVNFVFIGIVIFCLLITYAIHRYGLFALSPQTAAADILRAMPDGLILADMDGRVVTANASAAEIFGMAEADLPGFPVERLIPDTAHAAIRAAITGPGRFSDIEAAPGGKEGSVVSIAGAPVRNPDGEPEGFVLIIRDITGRKAVETALQATSQKLSLLSRVTCHDIGNDITALSWYLHLLSEDRAHPDAGTYLASSIDIVGNIIDHLNFSREYQTVGAYQPIWQSLNPMVTRAVSGVRHPGIQIATRIAPVEVYADPLLPRVVYNLIENAIRHGGGVSRICVTTDERDEGALVVAVEDDGEGIPEGEKEKMFTYGYGKNSGFGLAFSRDVLSVTDIALCETGTAGRGARFEILIPPRGWRRAEEEGEIIPVGDAWKEPETRSPG